MKRGPLTFALTLVLLVGLFSGARVGTANGAMNDYCSVPPFVMTAVTPSVSILMDFSGSMQFPAYLPCSWQGYTNKTGRCWDGSHPIVGGADYVPTAAYYGYFDSTKYYQYDTTNSYFKINSSCANTNKIGQSGCISGNLLNWVTSTRVDVARKAMTGGRTGGSDAYLNSEGAQIKYHNIDAANGLYCSFRFDHSDTNSPNTRRLTIENILGQPSCVLGALSTAEVQAKVESGPVTGIVDNFYSKVNFEFIYYNSDNKGVVPTGGVKGATLANLKSAINTQIPYNGTPTGEALWEAYDLYRQSNDHAYVNNSGATAKGDCTKDPYYDCSASSSIAIPCRKGFVLLLSDGAWNGDVDPVIAARSIRRGDLRSDTGLSSNQYVTVYTIYTFGDLDPGVKAQGRTALITTAIFGGYDYTSTDAWPYPFTGVTAGLTSDCGSAYDNSQKSNITDVGANTWCNSRAVNFGATPNNYPLPQCNPAGTWNDKCKGWDPKKTGLPYNFFEADDGAQLEVSITNALADMVSRVSSGTAASVLASSEGSGANILQAIFYPKRSFGTTEIAWTGEMQNLWYYIDPFLQGSSIREDTDENKKLDLDSDRVIEFFFDSDDNQVKANRLTTAGTLIDTIKLEEIKNLWEAGHSLWSRTDARTIHTTLDGDTFTDFSLTTAGASSTFRSYIQASGADETARIADAQKVVNYIHGVDQTGYRNRTIAIGAASHVWKLGDIIDSTPRAQTSSALNSYHLQPPNGYQDGSYARFVNSTGYRSRGMAYVGANDGMLHAFRIGTLLQQWTGQGSSETAYLSGADLGKEEWAYIPKNALPYLKYLADPNYCHLYYVDAPNFLVDASVGAKGDGDISGSDKPLDGSTWRTVLIGGSGLGGACRTTCSTTECVQTPVSGVGLSSYFAIDVTDPVNPVLLWEYSHEALGFATSGPAIVRIGPSSKNGKWFVVFGSGPTGPIDTTYHEFLGKSDQTLKLFVLDLKTGLPYTFSGNPYKETGISNAFAGSLYNGAFDADRGAPLSGGHYQDDAVYVGYTKKCTGLGSPSVPCVTGTWTDGGVLRVLTQENTNPASWSVSSVIDGIGPVTTAVTKLQNRSANTLWLYFGTGRFFYKRGSELDDQSGQRRLYGVKEPCYGAANSMTITCTSAAGTLTDQSSDSPAATLASTSSGWFVNLDVSGSVAERVITDPLAVFSGVVFFTTFAPSADACTMGGNTYLWALNYNSGGAATLPGGKALLQVSTGEIKQVRLSEVYTQRGNRRSLGLTGVPPKGQGLSVLVGPRPTKKVLQVQEK